MMKTRRILNLCMLLFGLTTIHAQTVKRLVVINSTSDTEISELSLSGDTIDIDAYPYINFRAETSPEPLASGKCVFELTPEGGTPYLHSEGGAPYALFGDISGDYNEWAKGYDSPPPFIAGTYTLKVTPGTGVAVSYQFVLENKGGSTGGEGGETGEGEPMEIADGEVKITGELKQWHNISLNIGGPSSSETATPNPFKDYRLQATFTKGDKSLTVPGYFAADGNAKETGAVAGNIWKIHFCPSEVGTWNYTISFRNGENVALSSEDEVGSTVAPLDGMTGTIDVLASDKEGRDFRSRGRLEYVGERYLKFAGTGEYFVKMGPDSPENLLAYNDIDNTPNSGSKRKSYADHVRHWGEGDPTWKGGKGKGLIGAVHYLASKGVNSISFLTMNINGDDKNVYPYVTSSNKTQFDCSKLDQWDVVFSYAQSLGIYLHFKTQETENERLLDDGNTSYERKLYYRELIARYGHYLALNWNLGEENDASFNKGPTQNDTQRKAMAEYFFNNDPYKNHIVIHTAPGDLEKVYTPLLGDKSKLTGISVQTDYSNVHNATKTWVAKSTDAGKPWVVANDEQGSAKIGVPYDDYTGTPNKDQIRDKVLWGNLMAGGAGVEYYFGYDLPHSDLTCQDFTTRDKSWEYGHIATTFFNKYIPFWEMTSNDNLTTKGYCFSKSNSVYVVYLPSGGTASVALGAGTYKVQWYNPRTGGDLIDGLSGLAGGALTSIGAAPDNNDWVALITEAAFTHEGNSGAPIETIDLPEEPEELPAECGDPIILSSFTDFTKFTDIPGFKNAYKDNGNQCLAINAAQFKGEFAAAQNTFAGQTGSYNITITTLRELDGESTYRLRVGGTLIGEYKNPETDVDYAPSTFTWPNVTVTTGDVIQVEFSSHTNGKIPENGGTAFSRGRWTQVRLGPVCQNCDGPYLEEGGIVMMEPENVELHQDWTKRPSTYLLDPTMAGSKGNGWVEWNGAEKFATTLDDGAVNGVGILRFKITKEGVYTFRWRSKQYNAGQAGDAGNDTYVKFHTGTPQVMTGTKGTKYTIDKYTKVWIQSKQAWSWGTNFEPAHGEFVNFPKVHYTPGIHEIRIAGRSKGHAIDRLALYHSSVSWNEATFTALPESKREGCEDIVPVKVTATDVYVKHDTLVLFANDEYTLGAVVLPINTSYPELKWTSSDANLSVDDSGKIKGLSAGEYTVLAKNDSSGLEDACHVIVLEDKDRIKLDKMNWTALYADSEDTEKGGGLKEKAIDGDLATFWHTQWFSAKPALPHEIQIDLGEETNIDFIDYWHRQDEWGPNGAIGEYEIYISNSTDDWGAPVKKDYMRWANECTKEEYKEMQRVFLKETAKGRYLRVVALSEAQNDPETPLTAIAELDVWQYDVENAMRRIQASEIQVFPNPCETWLEVKAPMAIKSIEVYQMDGRRVFENKHVGSSCKVFMQSMEEGIYLLKIQTEDAACYSQKIVKK